MYSKLFTSAFKYGFILHPSLEYLRTSSGPYPDNGPSIIALSFSSMMMEYGYIPSNEMFFDLCLLTPSENTTKLFESIDSSLESITGKKMVRNARIFYNTFPEVDYSLFEQRILAIIHYFSHGTFYPSNFNKADVKKTRIDSFSKYKELSFISYQNMMDYTQGVILCAKNSLPVDDLEFVKNMTKYAFDNLYPKWEMVNFELTKCLPNITCKETLATYIGVILPFVRSASVDTRVKLTVTDILRIATAISGGDVSLAANTKFKLNKPIRRGLCELLKGTNLKKEDLLLHKNKWIKLFHNLHIGDYGQDLFDFARSIRENEKIDTYGSKLEFLILAFSQKKSRHNLYSMLNHMATRPSIFVRNIGRLAKIISDYGNIVPKSTKDKFMLEICNTLEKIIHDVPNRVLYQFLTFINSTDVECRVFFPKGMTTKYFIKKDENYKFPFILTVYDFERIVFDELRKRWSMLTPLGNVYINNELDRCTINNGLRNVTPGKQVVSRGCKVPFECKDTLRMFLYWIGYDLDLAASFLNDKFQIVNECSFRQTAARYAQHSGDITYAPAPEGASEYIDIDLNAARKSGIRYIAMHIFVYNGSSFDEMEKCCVGWMQRSDPKYNNVYEPSTVKQYIDLNSKSKSYMPVVFDLLEQTVCYVDMNMKMSLRNCLTIGTDGYNQAALLKSMLQKNGVTLGKILKEQCKVRGATIVDDPKEAEVVFDMEQGITPYNYLELENWV